MKKIIPLLLVALSIFACKKEPKINDLDSLFTMMQGSYNSEAQAEQDSAYYNISLHMYPIWEDKGNWLYVEQALNATQDKPYRQRLYEVKQLNDSTFASYIYTLANASDWVGKWKTPQAFDSLDVKDITLRKGCEVLLNKFDGKNFKGRTGEKTCESTLRGASFATSEVELTPERIISWDRGFDAEGNHVWGADKGGYIFDKLVQ
ncbi:MAG: chromophore lyase CpcT/CpeT [Bacteroidia bacterium]|nr:chromophore lyase CpcT/CpeT [Bacteroidia bacterium]MBT8309954.1 chromophore lyase CpcT/CpeT [Bacteroidia bacterium]NND09775.1 hypothetical protein [Flavobacteriaceae bacterium]NNL61984.1 hypothetical protein [Flavobacteriaceae bacterium]RZV67299.1 MAG: hypothetical protein EX254_02995 [Flavobacteriaceae bacterium]